MPDRLADTEEPPRHKAARTFSRRFGCALVFGFVLTIVALAAVRIGRRAHYVPLNREQFAQAQERWKAHGLDEYAIEIKVTGRQPAEYRVEVRRGDPTAAYRNRQPLPQRRSWMTWTVPGMFGTVESDLMQLERAARGEPGIPGLSVLVEFDEQYGFPKRYLRVESTRQAANPEVTWEVTSFGRSDGSRSE